MSLPLKVATVCLLRRNNEIFFLDYRKYDHLIHKGVIAPPGGKREGDETLESCAIRETIEETGIVPRNLSYRATVTFLNERRLLGGKPAKYNWEVHFYETSEFDDSNQNLAEGLPLWVPKNKILEYNLHEGDRVIFPLFEQYKQFKLEIIHEGTTLTEKRILSYALK